MKSRKVHNVMLSLGAALLFASQVSASEEIRFTHGPMLGRLSADSVGVWARTSRTGSFRVRYGLNSEQLDRVSKKASTRLENDNTAWIQLVDLSPNTKYFYQLEFAEEIGTPSKVGSFRTLPSRSTLRDPKLNPEGLFNFRFEFGCGNKPPSMESVPQRPAYVTMLRELDDEIDFAILNGDWIYELKRDYSVSQWLTQVGQTQEDLPEIVGLTPPIVGVWENYKSYLEMDPNLATWHREIPSYFTFDDHEILNDLSGAGEIGYRNARTVFRDIGVRAWYDYLGWSMFPSFHQESLFGKAELKANSDILVDEAADFSLLDLGQAGTLHVHSGQIPGERGKLSGNEDPNLGVYEIVEVLDRHRLQIRPPALEDSASVYSIGRLSYWRMRVSNCEFLFLDTRSHRGIHDKQHPFKPGVAMLGQKQKRWLKETMKESDADFFFVVSTVNLMIPHVDASGDSNKDEAWTSFLEEREDLIEFWDGLGKPVFVLTGDLHNSLAIKITDRVWEFASGPHSSTNHSAPHEGNRPANGPFVYGPRPCDIRWSSYVLGELGRTARLPHYCVVQINNVFANPGTSTDTNDSTRWIAFPQPHVVFQYYEGNTGRLAYAESVFAASSNK